MAKKLHLSTSHLSSIEHGKRAIPKDMKQLLVNAYNLTDVQIEKIDKAIKGISDKTDLTSLSYNTNDIGTLVKYNDIKKTEDNGTNSWKNLNILISF